MAEERKEEQRNYRLTLPMSILIAGVLISGSIIYLVGSKNRPVPTGTAALPSGQASAADLSDLLSLKERDVILGEPDAPITFVEYGDYQCPFCGRFFNQTEPLLRDNYISSGKIKMIYRNLAFLGPESRAAAEAAECAKDQGRFWAYHDELFKEETADGKENNGNLNRALFITLAERVGMDIAEFTSCFDDGRYKETVGQEMREAQALGVNAAPTSFVKGELVQGAQPYAVFQAVIEKHLNQ